MLLPFLPAAAGHAHQHGPAAPGLGPALAAVAVHSLAMLATTALVALLVHDRLGVAVLRHAWLNLDRLWTAALALTGLWLLA
jgi:hypothetical protein